MKATSTVLALALLCATGAPAQSAKVSGIPYVRTVGGIEEHRLESNGLQILILPQNGAPVATFMVTYHVGSRNEVTGTTGATHLLEHLMFKGTALHDRSMGTSYDQILERVGAETNATTWLDRTNYFATVPSNALPLLIEVEADRMRNLALREEDRRPEMSVVRNEFERGENSPMEALSKEMWASAFIAHPYHHETIGWRSDIEGVPIDKLRAFYDTFYWPDNATVTVIGSFDAASTLAAIKKEYGRIPKSPHPFPQIYTEEPSQSGQRRVTLKRAGELGIVALAHKIPQATHPDWPAIQVFSSILSWGRTSRCYKALTDRNLTINVDSFPSFTHDPSLHLTFADVANGVKHEDVEKALVAEIERIKTEGVTDSEVRTAQAGILARRAYSRDGSFALAAELNECIAVGDWSLYATMEASCRAVSASDVQRVAQKYFIENHSVAGWFIPSTTDTDAESDTVKSESFAFKDVQSPKPLDRKLEALPIPGLEKRVKREEVEGIDVLVCSTPVKGMAHIIISLPVGQGVGDNKVLARITASMLERGTMKHDQYELADIQEKAGITVEQRMKVDTLEFSVKCLSKDIPTAVSLLGEELRSPAFSHDEFAKLKTELASSLQQTLENTDLQAAIAFSRAVFPDGHPSRQATVEELVGGVNAAKIEDVKAFHTSHYGPTGMHLIAVGDVDPAILTTEITKTFRGWAPQPKAAKSTPKEHATDQLTADVNLPDKASVSVVIGQRSGLKAGDPGWLALRVATDVLGRGFTSRLVGNVRDREGLTYGIGATTQNDTFRSGDWRVQGTFAPALLEKGLASTRRVITDWWENGISAEELDYRKSAIAGQFAVSLETTEGLASQLLQCVERGFALSWLDQFPAKVNALTLEEVNAAIKRHLDPAKMTTVRAGTLK